MAFSLGHLEHFEVGFRIFHSISHDMAVRVCLKSDKGTNGEFWLCPPLFIIPTSASSDHVPWKQLAQSFGFSFC